MFRPSLINDNNEMKETVFLTQFGNVGFCLFVSSIFRFTQQIKTLTKRKKKTTNKQVNKTTTKKTKVWNTAENKQPLRFANLGYWYSRLTLARPSYTKIAKSLWVVFIAPFFSFTRGFCRIMLFHSKTLWLHSSEI